MTSRRVMNPLLIAATLMLAGCGGLFGGGGRADLYRFGDAAPVAEPAQPAAQQRPVILAYPGATFDSAVGTERILTVNGSQASYIAGARWISPASELFDAAALRELERFGPDLRLVRSVEIARADYLLLVDVRRFEAVYTGGLETVPAVAIEAHARLFRRSDRAIVGEWAVNVTEPATENRVTAIVDAFSRATATATQRIAALAAPAAIPPSS